MLAGVIPDLGSFDPDEVLLLIGSGVLCLGSLVHWIVTLRRISRLGSHPLHRAPIYLAGLIGFLSLAWVVWRWGDPQIRANSGYILLVFLMGGACLTLASALFPWLGIGLRDDALERRNLAAVLALSGAILGVLVTYSAATTGEGPSFWNNVFSSLLATGTLLACWLMVLALGGAAAAISEGHDVASGLRLGVLMAALGLILGRAVAGNWESVAATTRDFARDGWPALALTLGAVAVERMLRPTRRAPHPSVLGAGLVPSFLYLLAALAWVAHLGWWEGA